VWTAAQCRELDRVTIERFGVPGLELMEVAGAGAADRIAANLDGRALVLCGGGNNGGDGYVVARHLHARGHDVVVAGTLPAAKLSGDARVNRERVDALGIAVHDLPDVAAWTRSRPAWGDLARIVDGILGTGFRGPVRADLAGLLEAVDADATPVTALDVPSGLDADRGVPWDVAVRAELTLTFAARKVGFDAPGAAAWTGDVVPLPIGAPAEAYALVEGLRDVQ
jgi:NAD(P)H-hydrate epimerase